MKLHRLIRADRVFLDLQADDVQSALRAVAEKIQAGVPSDRVVAALTEREQLGSTSVGDGFAIPHCKLAGLKTILVAAARLGEGIPFGTEDTPKVSFMFVVLSPPDQPAAHLQVLSQIARVLKRKDLRRDLMAAANPDSVVQHVQEASEAEGL